MMKNNIKAQIWILKWMDDNPDHTKEEALIALKKAEQMTKTQTAIEWLIERLEINNSVSRQGEFWNLLKNQAKQMEEDQINKAWENGFRSTGEGWNGEIPPECQGEVLDTNEYYNETYGK